MDATVSVTKIYIPEPDKLDEAFGAMGTWVGPRTGLNPRTQESKELWCLRRYIFTLCSVSQLRFPICIEKSESPDFRCSFGPDKLGIEVTEATDPRDQEEMTIFEREGIIALRGSRGGRFPRGAAGDAPEREWWGDVQKAVGSKVTKIARWPNQLPAYSLLLYTNSNAGSHIFDWQRLFNGLAPQNRRLWKDVLGSSPVESIAVICDRWLLVLRPEDVSFYRLPASLDDEDGKILAG
jgi:hypothetical protein